jgi:hypothetical protein
MLSLAFYKSTFCISAIIVLAAWPDDFDVTVPVAIARWFTPLYCIIMHLLLLYAFYRTPGVLQVLCGASIFVVSVNRPIVETPAWHQNVA